MNCFAAALIICGILPVTSQAQSLENDAWQLELVDPAAVSDDSQPADLLLPMPCGAAMAFQRVEVPLDKTDPLADRQIRLGVSDESTGYSDYLRQDYLRGPFESDATEGSHYYIARYELTEGQFRVLQGDCSQPGRPDRLAKGNLSWFDAVNLGQVYTSWLHENASDALPRRDDAPSFLRLPTEAEWEYATRGGAAIDPTLFPARVFFDEGSLPDFGFIEAPGSGNGHIMPIGLRKANPLGLYDVYGNVEELMLEPFRLNVLGRFHGQAGGLVTRGGSSFSSPDQVYSAKRVEYGPYDPDTGAPRRGEAFGLRFVISTQVSSSDSRLLKIQNRWVEAAGARQRGIEQTNGARIDPLSRLANLIASEIDTRRQQALVDLQMDIRQQRAVTDTAIEQSANASLLAGAVFVQSLNDTARDIASHRSNILTLNELNRAEGGTNERLRQQISVLTGQITAKFQMQCTLILSYRATLEALTTDIDAETRRRAYTVLREELILSNRQALLGILDEFWRDIALFELSPDMGPVGLLGLALTTEMTQAQRNSTRC